MKIQELLESKSANLYMAVSSPYFFDQLKEDRMYATVIHRWWKNGLRYDRNDENYKDHVWIKGLSLSRNLNFCLKWNPYIFTFDQQKLTNQYKLMPFKWGKKDESEEFLWMHTSNITGDGSNTINYANDKTIFLQNLHNFIKEITISNNYGDILKSLSNYNENIEIIQNYCAKYKLKLQYK